MCGSDGRQLYGDAHSSHTVGVKLHHATRDINILSASTIHGISVSYGHLSIDEQEKRKVEMISVIYKSGFEVQFWAFLHYLSYL